MMKDTLNGCRPATIGVAPMQPSLLPPGAVAGSLLAVAGT
jgi:hypothetical protein